VSVTIHSDVVVRPLAQLVRSLPPSRGITGSNTKHAFLSRVRLVHGRPHQMNPCSLGSLIGGRTLTTPCNFFPRRIHSTFLGSPASPSNLDLRVPTVSTASAATNRPSTFELAFCADDDAVESSSSIARQSSPRSRHPRALGMPADRKHGEPGSMPAGEPARLRALDSAVPFHDHGVRPSSARALLGDGRRAPAGDDESRHRKRKAPSR